MNLRGSGLLVFLLLMQVFSKVEAAEVRIRCASTTSTQNSGFFDHVLPIFEKKTGIKVDVLAVGTEAAIELGKRGDMDVVVAHAKALELEALKEGYFVERHDFMHNDFVVVGPSGDPPGIKAVDSVAAAFKKIAGHPFISRGDKSGTHLKELSIWKSAGIDPKGKEWYLEAGQGMEKTLRIADEKMAYTLTDRGTWLALKDKSGLCIVFEEDPLLFNQYGVMAVNPGRHKHVRYKEAMVFINWLISAEGKEAISSFRDKNGNPLFEPD